MFWKDPFFQCTIYSLNTHTYIYIYVLYCSWLIFSDYLCISKSFFILILQYRKRYDQVFLKILFLFCNFVNMKYHGPRVKKKVKEIQVDTSVLFFKSTYFSCSRFWKHFPNKSLFLKRVQVENIENEFTWSRVPI